MTSLAQPVQAVVTLFEGPLAGVRFADVDAAGLSKLAAEVSRAASELEQQEVALATLRQELAQWQEALLALAQQGLAYARIYAEGDDALLAELNAIALPRAAKARKPSVVKSATEAVEASPPAASDQVEAAAPAPADEEASDEPLKTKPSYARPKIKRRLGRAASPSDSA
jgi:hypothetical protein